MQRAMGDIMPLSIRLCKECGAAFDAAGGRDLCPDCAERSKTSVMRERVCRQCGARLWGGPRAWYCPSCRVDRARSAQARYRAGVTKRPLGSTDRCTVCGAEYVVQSGRQKYCPSCAAAAVRQIDREQSKTWNAHHKDKAAGQGRAPRACLVCGAIIPAERGSLSTCSEECAKQLRAYRQAKADYKRGHRKKPPSPIWAERIRETQKCAK